MARIVRDPLVRGGSPVIRGTRVTVADILAQVAAGSTHQTLLKLFPLLEPDDIEAALRYAIHSVDAAAPGRPAVSVVVVVHRMPEQAKRTLYSLSTDYQTGVSENDYEVIVVENSSDQLLGKHDALQYRMKTRYFYRDESAPTPIAAMNFGVSQATAPNVALVIDGARMVTPGVISLCLTVSGLGPSPVLSVPGYHLGSSLQQDAVSTGYDERKEAALLTGIEWPSNGYRLFEISVLSGSCRGGFLKPFAESNFLCLRKSLFDKLGGYDREFVSFGGGYCNLDLYKRVCDRPEVDLYVTPGEGSFHQFHGGATTGGTRDAERARLLDAAHDEYAAIRGHRYRLPNRQGVWIGAVPEGARRFVELSASDSAPPGPKSRSPIGRGSDLTG